MIRLSKIVIELTMGALPQQQNQTQKKHRYRMQMSVNKLQISRNTATMRWDLRQKWLLRWLICPPILQKPYMRKGKHRHRILMSMHTLRTTKNNTQKWNKTFARNIYRADPCAHHHYKKGKSKNWDTVLQITCQWRNGRFQSRKNSKWNEIYIRIDQRTDPCAHQYYVKH